MPHSESRNAAKKFVQSLSREKDRLWNEKETPLPRVDVPLGNELLNTPSAEKAWIQEKPPGRTVEEAKR